jgi:hypothetical protein
VSWKISGKVNAGDCSFFVVIPGPALSPWRRDFLHPGEGYYTQPVEMDAMVQGKCSIPGFRFGEYEFLVQARTKKVSNHADETGTIRGYSQVNEA